MTMVHRGIQKAGRGTGMETCNYSTESTKIYPLSVARSKVIGLIASHFLVVFDVELQLRLRSGLGMPVRPCMWLG